MKIHIFKRNSIWRVRKGKEFNILDDDDRVKFKTAHKFCAMKHREILNKHGITIQKCPKCFTRGIKYHVIQGSKVLLTLTPNQNIDECELLHDVCFLLSRKGLI